MMFDITLKQCINFEKNKKKTLNVQQIQQKQFPTKYCKKHSIAESINMPDAVNYYYQYYSKLSFLNNYP